MKKAFFLCAFCALILLAGCGGARESAALDRDASFFSDFSIDGEQVVFDCHLVIDNNTDAAVSVRITGDFSADADAGLLKETRLPAAAKDGGASVFVLQPGKNTIDVVFTGTHGDIDTKLNRLLPGITIEPAG